jgi:hypothetical protein
MTKTAYSMTPNERLAAVEVGDVWAQKNSGRLVTVTEKTQFLSDFYTVEFLDDKGKPRSRWLPNFLQNFELETRAGIVSLEVGLSQPLTSWSSAYLRRLADECERIIAERNADGATA